MLKKIVVIRSLPTVVLFHLVDVNLSPQMEERRHRLEWNGSDLVMLIRRKLTRS